MKKPSFKVSASTKRCILPVNGFFEHHHYKGNTYPFHITLPDNKVMNLAGMHDEWVDKETGELIKSFTIVTTPGNELMSKIHNNPKLKEA